MPDQEFSLGGTDTHVPALDDAPETSASNEDVAQGAEETQVEEVEEGQPEEVAADQPDDQGGIQDDDPLLATYAKRMHLDPSDPGQRKTLETVIAKEKFIQELQAKVAKLEAGSGAQQNDGLTPFERELQRQAQEAQTRQQNEAREPQQPTQGTQAQAQRPAQYNDAGAQWRDPFDAYNDLTAAWGEAHETGDYRKVNGVEAALFQRRFDAIAAPVIEQMVEARLQKFAQERLGDIEPFVRESVSGQRQREAADFALAELSKTNGYEDVKLLETEDDGPPIVVNGEEYKSTPLNRILAENDWILHIKRDHADPKVADRLTYLARLKAAHKIWSASKVSTQKAKRLIDAGAKVEQRKQQDRVRQGLNSGSGTAGALGKSGTAQKSYVQDLLSDPDEPISFANL